MSEQSTRINKYLSEIGYCSRREADRLVQSGKVKINGKLAENGSQVTAKDTILVHGKPVGKPPEKFVYLAFHKPIGIVCTTDQKREKNNIIDYIKYPKRIFPVGRLDKPSEGLILMTNDGNIVNKILRARNNHEKEYIVTVNKPITPEFIRRIREGVPILDTVTRKCEAKRIDSHSFQIILTQGLNRQIRRMCEYLGYEVKKLKRIRIMNIHLDIPVGKLRELSKAELKELNKLLADSQKTHLSEASANTLPKTRKKRPRIKYKKP